MAANQIAEILKKFAEKHENTKLVAIADESGLVIGVYPYREDKLELVDNLVAIFSDMLSHIVDGVGKFMPSLATGISSISVGIGNIKIEFYMYKSYRVLIFRAIS